MPENETKVWEISESMEIRGINFPNTTNLDAITRRLPQGYYSTFRTFEGGKRVLGLQAHLGRLYKPARMQDIKVSIDEEVLHAGLNKILHEYDNEVRVRVILAQDGRVFLITQVLTPLAPEIYSQGVKVVTSEVKRENPRLKSTTFISSSESERADISRRKIFEALLVRNGVILEGMTSNFFYVRDGVLGTARKSILLGVTRRIVLRVARGRGLDILYRPLQREQVPGLSEAFITSSSRGIVPVVRIDDIRVGEGLPGLITKNLMEGYINYVKKHAEMI